MIKQKIYLIEVDCHRKYESPTLEIFEGDIKEHIKYMKETHGATLRVFELKEKKIK
jgi:hypothetical protein